MKVGITTYLLGGMKEFGGKADRRKCRETNETVNSKMDQDSQVMTPPWVTKGDEGRVEN